MHHDKRYTLHRAQLFLLGFFFLCASLVTVRAGFPEGSQLLALTTATAASSTDVSGNPVITGVLVLPGEGLVRWNTDIPSDSTVLYQGNDGTHGVLLDRCDAGGMVTTHCVTILSLTSSAGYLLQVRSGTVIGAPVTYIPLGGTPNIVAPTSPGQLTFDASLRQLSWVDTSANEAEFRVYRAPLVSGPYELVGNTFTNDVTYAIPATFTGIAFYQVASCAGDVCSVPTAPIRVALGVPGPMFVGTLDITATVQSVDIRWPIAEDPTGIAKYEVVRDGVFLVDTRPDAGGYRDLDVLPGHTYHYVVSAYAVGGGKSALAGSVTTARLLRTQASTTEPRVAALSDITAVSNGSTLMDGDLVRGEVVLSTAPSGAAFRKVSFSAEPRNGTKVELGDATRKIDTDGQATFVIRVDTRRLGSGAYLFRAIGETLMGDVVDAPDLLLVVDAVVGGRARTPVVAPVVPPADVPMGSGELASTSVTLPSAMEQLLARRQELNIFLDSDGDGITDFDEAELYHTNPKLKDTDKDGVEDGAELLAHTDPLIAIRIPTSVLAHASTTLRDETVVFADPHESGDEDARLVVDRVDVAATTTNTTGSTTISQIAFQGRALPNAYVTLFIYSDPIIVTVKADAEGVWKYTLERPLPDGKHEVFTTMTDNSGRIVARSAPLPFVQEAEALTLGGEAVVANAVPAPSFFASIPLATTVFVLIAVLGGAIAFIGYFVRRGREVDNGMG